MVKLVTVSEMQAIERDTDAAGVSYAAMMELAGSSVARVIMSRVPNTSKILVLVGPGNNGGDGLVAARVLRESGWADVCCYLFKPRPDDDPVYASTLSADVPCYGMDDDAQLALLKELAGSANVLVDALLGTGARLPVRGSLAEMLSAVSETQGKQVTSVSDHGLQWPAQPEDISLSERLVIAVDCPSGLDCDTGDLDDHAIGADITVTFAAAKYGQVQFPGAAAVGRLCVADIGTPQDLRLPTTVMTELVTGSMVRELLPERPADGHKGTFGKVVVAAGSASYTGAAALAAESAYRAGAGLVCLAVPEIIYPSLSANLREPIWHLLPHDNGFLSGESAEVFLNSKPDYNALLVGPGIGLVDRPVSFVQRLLGYTTPQSETQTALPVLLGPVIIDADGLNQLASLPDWWHRLPDETVLTPHPGEMARMTGLTRAEIQNDRISTARTYAEKWGCVVVLKGAFTVVSAPDGKASVLPFANSALATAGTGDVLAGCIAGLMAQKINAFEAAVAGAYIHGLAGEFASTQLSPRTVMASDVLSHISTAFRALEQ